MIDQELHYKMLDAAETYLENQKATLWGRAFDLSQDESRTKAAAWFVNEIQKLHEFLGGES